MTFLILASGNDWCLKSSELSSAVVIVCCQNLDTSSAEYTRSGRSEGVASLVGAVIGESVSCSETCSMD